MRKAVTVFAVLATLMVLSTGEALAAGEHFKKGGTPTCTISGAGTNSQSVVCRGVLAGLGNEDLTITTSVSGFAVYQCQNNGGNIAPGQNRVLVGPSTVATPIDSSAIKNGNLSFTTLPNTLSAPATVSGSQAGCPGNNWTGVNPTLTVTQIGLTIVQGGDTLFTCTSATDPNGLSGTVALTC
jgi:hypothetical protein